MPTFNEHQIKAKHNESFFTSFDVAKTSFLDWVVVGIFYTALHLIDAYFARKTNGHPISHRMRDEWIGKDPNLKKVYYDYRDLKDFRRAASYQMQTFTSVDVQKNILPCLNSIKNELKNCP